MNKFITEDGEVLRIQRKLGESSLATIDLQDLIEQLKVHQAAMVTALEEICLQALKNPRSERLAAGYLLQRDFRWKYPAQSYDVSLLFNRKKFSFTFFLFSLLLSFSFFSFTFSFFLFLSSFQSPFSNSFLSSSRSTIVLNN